jgi:hypothetical protein
MLSALAALHEPCACVPHARLEQFYARAGFRARPDGSGPAFLDERAACYRARGLRVLVMHRNPQQRLAAPGS